MLLLADGRAPVGGNVNSGGLEPALQGGMPPGDVRRYLAARLRTSTAVEAGIAVLARHVVITAAPEDLAGEIARIEMHWAARTPSPAQRATSRLLGRGYLRLARTIWPDPVFEVIDSRDPRPSRGTVIGAIAGVTGMLAADTARLVLYEESQSVVAAYLKLHPADPVVAARWVHEACRAAEPLVRLLTRISDPEAVPASGSPQNEAWAEIHALSTERLFRA